MSSVKNGGFISWAGAPNATRSIVYGLSGRLNMAKASAKPLYIIWNDDLGECAEPSFFQSEAKAKEHASDLNDEYSYSIWECYKIAEEASRTIVWKDIP
jgi:hypothetical protein